MSVSPLSDTLPEILRYSSWLMVCYRGNPLQSIRLCPFWTRPSFVPMVMYNFAGCVISFSDKLNVYHSPAHLHLSFHLSLPVQCQLQRLSELLQTPVPLWFPLPNVVITNDATSNHWAFIFRVIGFTYPVVASGLVPCARCILSVMNSRLLHWLCWKWPLSYPVWWLSYICTIVLLKFIYVIKGGQYLCVFPD